MPATTSRSTARSQDTLELPRTLAPVSTAGQSQPVIIIGMHRSGTSLLTRLLDQLGLFVGWKKQGDHEALFFLALNDWMMAQCGGSWEQPNPIENLLQHRDARRLVADYLGVSLRSTRVFSFLGPGKIWKRCPSQLSGPWGWKDPRNTLTLPIWLDLFPHAKIIHCFRHGVDVADSLYRRQETFLREREERYRKLRFTYLFRAKETGFTNGLRCASIDEGFRLWESYMRAGRQHVQKHPNQSYELKYEDLLAEPSKLLPEVARFCGLDVTQAQCDALTAGIRADRAYAFRRNPERVAFAESVADRLAEYGYPHES